MVDELPLGNQEEPGLSNISTPRYEDEWEHVPSKNNKPAYKLNSSTDFPVLRNRFEVPGLKNSCNQSEHTRPCSWLSMPDQRTESKQNWPSPSKLPRPSRQPTNISIYADSQGRGIAQYLNEVSEHKVFGLVKPNTKFLDVSQGCYKDTQNFTVFIAGTNDIARNERRDLI